MVMPRKRPPVDAEAFEEAAAAYRAAVDLYAGDLLPEDCYEEWAEARREGLRTTYVELLVELKCKSKDPQLERSAPERSGVFSWTSVACRLLKDPSSLRLRR
jgi:hypothetical protein